MPSAPFWSAGFRAFFWLGALNVPASMATWLAFLSGVEVATQGWPAQSLHAHEMLHGTVVAAIAGFLLTAVPNWTSTNPLRGGAVMALVVLWLAGRVALALGDVLPGSVVLAIDVSFLPVLACVVGWPIVRSRKPRNLAVVGVLLVLAVANVAMHVALGNGQGLWMRWGVYGSVYAVVLLMLIIAGRIVPLFTRNALARDGVKLAIQGNPAVGAAALGTTVAALAIELVEPGSPASAWLALLAAPLLLARQVIWKPWHALPRPILWILHLGHAWIAVGLACHGVAILTGRIPLTAALHAFTAGAMGCLILGMMTRVSLGHTGRPIEASPLTVLAYVAVAGSAALRIFWPVLDPMQTLLAYQVSGSLFAGAYLLFLVAYTPVLWGAAQTR